MGFTWFPKLLSICEIEYAISGFDPPLNVFKRLMYWLFNKRVFTLQVTVNEDVILSFDVKFRKRLGRVYLVPPIRLAPTDSFSLKSNCAIPCNVFINPVGLAIEKRGPQG